MAPSQHPGLHMDLTVSTPLTLEQWRLGAQPLCLDLAGGHQDPLSLYEEGTRTMPASVTGRTDPRSPSEAAIRSRPARPHPPTGTKRSLAKQSFPRP